MSKDLWIIEIEREIDNFLNGETDEEYLESFLKARCYTQEEIDYIISEKDDV